MKTLAGTVTPARLVVDNDTVTPPGPAGPVRYTLPVVFWQPPVSTCDASSTFNSAAALTVVVELSVLFADDSSLSLLVADAELITVPAAVDLAVMVIVAVAPGAIVPRFAVTVPVEPTGGVTSEPCDVVAETKVIEADNVSVKIAPVAEFEAWTFFTTTL